MPPKIIFNNANLLRAALLLYVILGLALFTREANCEELSFTDEIVEKPGMFVNLLDGSHSFVVSRINAPAIWFDLFFGNPRTEDEEIPTTFVRLRTTARFTEGDGVKFPIRLRANLKLPRASRKLRLVITGENEDYTEKAGKEETSFTTGEEEGTEQSSVGLRYTLYNTVRSYFHFGGGVKDISPFEYYIRVVYRRNIHIGDRESIKFSQTGIWDSINDLGTTSRLDLEKKMSEITTGRISLYGTYSDSEINNGVEWGVEGSLFRLLSAKTALSLNLGTYGRTRPATEITNMIIAQRLRKNILRPWLFAEIETEVTFPLTEEDERKAIGAMAIIFEIQFASR